MIRIFGASVLVFIFFLALGCTDPSPLKSQLEVELNRTFQTEFDYLDRIEIYRLQGQESQPELLVAFAGDQVNSIGHLLAQSIPKQESSVRAIPYKIVLSTSKENLQYIRKQTHAELFLGLTDKGMTLQYDGKSYTLSSELQEQLSAIGVTP